MNELNILLVEDSRIARKMAQFVLLKMHDIVDTANTGAEAVQLSLGKKYDVILMDIGLDDISGYEASMRIRKNSMNEATPIVALTAHQDINTQESCIKAGMTEFMIKPFTREKFEEVLKNLGIAYENGS